MNNINPMQLVQMIKHGEKSSATFNEHLTTTGK